MSEREVDGPSRFWIVTRRWGRYKRRWRSSRLFTRVSRVSCRTSLRFCQLPRTSFTHATVLSFDFLAHPSCLVVEDPTFEAVKLICSLVRDAGPRAAVVGLDRFAARAGTG
jgi:hypothetical protein